MKRILLFSLAAATVAGLGYVAYSSADTAVNPAVERTEAAAGIDGAIQYMNGRRTNQVTGEIDPAWVNNAQNQTRAMRSAAAQKAAALGLQWEELGPDNIGGRTRGIVYDKNNPNVILTGGVAGGIWRTQDGGGSWAPVNDTMSSLSVVSLAQAANGDFYAGTGEGQFYTASGLKSQGIVGGGVFKSTDNGQTFTLLQSTKPTPNSTASDWAAVGKIACSPTDANRIYLANFGK